jgi:hypothetical protein
MILADHAGVRDLNERHRLWPFIETRAAELGLTGGDAVNRSPGPVRLVISASRKVSGPTPRQDNDCPARKHRDRAPGPADSPRRTSGPPPEDDIALDTASCAGRDSRGGRLAYSANGGVRLTGLSCELLYDQMRRGNLVYVEVARRCLITHQHMQRLLGIGS